MTTEKDQTEILYQEELQRFINIQNLDLKIPTANPYSRHEPLKGVEREKAFIKLELGLKSNERLLDRNYHKFLVERLYQLNTIRGYTRAMVWYFEIQAGERVEPPSRKYDKKLREKFHEIEDRFERIAKTKAEAKHMKEVVFYKVLDYFKYHPEIFIMVKEAQIAYKKLNWSRLY